MYESGQRRPRGEHLGCEVDQLVAGSIAGRPVRERTLTRQVPSVATSAAPAAAPSGPLLFGIVSLAFLMGSLDLTIVAVALPTIHKSLGASIAWVGWTITIYGLSTVVSLPIAGNLSNRLGTRRLFIIGVSLFTSASLLCGLATNIYLLILFRVFQGIGGAAFSPTATGLIAEHFGPARDKAIGAFAAVGSAGQIIGPIIGGLLVGYLSWRWIFFVNIPLGIAVVLLTMKYVPRSLPTTSAKTDFRGLMLLAGSVLTLIFGITSLGTGHNSLTSAVVFVPELCAAVFIFCFVRHLQHSSNPFVPVRLLTGKGFAVMNGINLLHGTVTIGIASLVPLYAEQRYHLAVLSAGTLLTPRAFGMIITGTIAALALRKTGYRLPLALGYIIIAFGTLLLSISPRWGLSPYAWLSICVAVIGLGIGWTNPAATNASMHLAPEHVSAITGLRGMFIQLGVIFAVAITTAILNRSANPGITQAHLYWSAPVIVFLFLIPLVTRVPEHEGGW